MILTGSEIKKAREAGDIVISPFHEQNIQPNSYDVTLSPNVAFYDFNQTLWLDSKKENNVPSLLCL